MAWRGEILARLSWRIRGELSGFTLEQRRAYKALQPLSPWVSPDVLRGFVVSMGDERFFFFRQIAAFAIASALDLLWTEDPSVVGEGSRISTKDWREAAYWFSRVMGHGNPDFLDLLTMPVQLRDRYRFLLPTIKRSLMGGGGVMSGYLIDYVKRKMVRWHREGEIAEPILLHFDSCIQQFTQSDSGVTAQGDPLDYH